MAGRYLGQMLVGLQADFFKVGHALGRQFIVEVFGDRVGVEPQAAALQAWRRQSQVSHTIANALSKLGGELAILHLLANVLGVVRLEDVVHVREHGAERKSHGGWRLLQSLGTDQLCLLGK